MSSNNRILVECQTRVYKGAPPKIFDAYKGKAGLTHTFEQILENNPESEIHKDEKGEWVYYCFNPGKGPTGRKIIGKIWGPFERISFFCHNCRQYTLVIKPSVDSVPVLTPEDIANPALKRLLFNEKP